MTDKYLDRLSKLLKLAENASTEDESSTYMAKAQQLATQYEIDLAIARAHTKKKEQREVPVQEIFNLGKARERGLSNQVDLISSLCEANNVRLNIAMNSTYVILFGFPSQIETVTALFGSLLVQMKAAGEAFYKGGTWKYPQNDAYAIRVGYWKKPHGLTERLSFEAGWAERVGYRVRQAANEAKAEAIAHQRSLMPVDDQGSTGAELALRQSALEVSDFYLRNSTARGSYRSAHYGSGRSRSEGYRAGDKARIGIQKALA